MNRIVLPLVLFITIFLSSCTDTYQLKRTQGAGIESNKISTAYIALPKDGSYGSIQYSGSGTIVAQDIGAAFSPYLREAIIGTQFESIEEAIRSASKLQFDYLVYPNILHWEDRATEWSGRSDVISVKVTIIDVSSSKVVDSVVIEGKSKTASWGGDRPEDLLAKPLKDYAAVLFK